MQEFAQCHTKANNESAHCTLPSHLMIFSLSFTLSWLVHQKHISIFHNLLLVHFNVGWRAAWYEKEQAAEAGKSLNYCKSGSETMHSSSPRSYVLFQCVAPAPRSLQQCVIDPATNVFINHAQNGPIVPRHGGGLFKHGWSRRGLVFPTLHTFTEVRRSQQGWSMTEQRSDWLRREIHNSLKLHLHFSCSVFSD